MQPRSMLLAIPAVLNPVRRSVELSICFKLQVGSLAVSAKRLIGPENMIEDVQSLDTAGRTSGTVQKDNEFKFMVRYGVCTCR